MDIRSYRIAWCCDQVSNANNELSEKELLLLLQDLFGTNAELDKLI